MFKHIQILMSALSDELAAVKASLDGVNTSLDSITAGIAALDAKIVAFNTSPGTLSAADQSALDGIQSASAALLAKAQGVSTTSP
jgi:hypothetical protein